MIYGDSQYDLWILSEITIYLVGQSQQNVFTVVLIWYYWIFNRFIKT